jgi:6-phosphofructokinase 1
MGGASVAMILHRIIADAFGWRGEFQVTESLPMCAADRGVKLDFQEAYVCGRQAVKLAVKGYNGVMVTLQRASKPKGRYKASLATIPLADVAVRARPMPDEFIADNGMDVTPAFLEYLAPLIGELPEYASLVGKRVK